jgi:ABC-2 type transport system permease protein
MSSKIITGELTQDLLRPISIFKSELASCFSSRVIALIMDLLPGMVIYSLIIYPTFLSPMSLLRFLAVAIPAFMINYICSFLLGLLAMSIKNNTSLNAISALLIAFAGGTLIPMEFYPQWLVNIANFLPYKYIYYWPIQFFLNRSPADNIQTMCFVLLIQLVWIISLFLLYKILWKYMIKKFCAVGG